MFGGLSQFALKMTFVLQELGKKQFLSPAIETNAIQKLAEYMTVYNKEEPGPDDKPTCAICFDMSGTGKTTTIMEASKNSGSIRAPISLIDNVLFKPLLKSCKNMGEQHNPPLEPEDLISYSKVEDYFEKRFEIVLAQLFQSIIDKLGNIKLGDTSIEITIPKYISPTKPGFDETMDSSAAAYERLTEIVKGLERLLVIHLDDCQEFFCGLTKTTEIVDGRLKAGEVMGFALQNFNQKVSALKKCRHILWVFSGTRPNLDLELKVASKFWEAYDVVDYLFDFDNETISHLLGKYFQLDDISEALKEKINHLCGPPKLLTWFIVSCQKFNLESVDDLIEKWDTIEEGAIGMYKKQIESTVKYFGYTDEMEIYARNLCLLHTHGFIKNADGFLEFNNYPNSWLPFTEAGLIRVRQVGAVWKLYPPNRFLVKIFEKYVKWFTRKNVEQLVTAIKFSTSDHTAKGKVFEYLFALELCSPTDSPLWKELGKLGLKPRTNWMPAVEKMGRIDLAIDKSKVYVMVDPDRSNSKTDVLFFATSISLNSEVRVLAQLTIQKKNSTEKAQTSFQGMLAYLANGYDFLSTSLHRLVVGDGTTDFLLFVSPRSTVDFAPEHKSAFKGSDCHWIDSSNLSSLLRFSLDLCDPENVDDSLNTLTNFALSLDDKALASWIKPSFNKRKRVFESMDDFYQALKEYGLDEEQKDKVKAIIEGQEILLKQLGNLTDAKLEKIGLVLGLRDAVLSVIENVGKRPKIIQ